LGAQKFMATKIDFKTQELCDAIAEQMETAGIRKRIDAFLADSAARSQYETVNNKGQALHEKQHASQPLSGEEIADFEKHRDALVKNPVAHDFLAAQEELHELQSSVQKRISKTLELGRSPTAEDLAEDGSCGHGCGCHH
jgi:cell fate (sporulation/competence/biofilm development) regulator YlbF (YheA/YmcA/DUF963 family)